MQIKENVDLSKKLSGRFFEKIQDITCWINILKEKKKSYVDEYEKIQSLLKDVLQRKIDVFNLKECFFRLEKEKEYLEGEEQI